MYFKTAMNLMAMSVATKVIFLGLETFLNIVLQSILYVLCLFMLIQLMCCVTYCNTAMNFMTMALATEVTFMVMECCWAI